MDITIGLSKVSGGHNALWEIIDRLTKLTYFVAVKDTTSTN